MGQAQLVSESAGTEKAPVMVLFGGNPYRRDEVIRLLSQLGDVTIYGTLSEAEGMAKLETLNRKVDFVVIGGAYSMEQRARIQAWVSENLPGVPVTQPGYDYPYSNEAISAAVMKTLNL